MKKKKARTLNKMIPYIFMEGKAEKEYVISLNKISNFTKSISKENLMSIKKCTNAQGVLNKVESNLKRANFNHNFIIIWVDYDRYDNKCKDTFNRICSSYKKIDFRLILSKPCIEGWFFSHFEKVFENQFSDECNCFVQKLENCYSNYKKGEVKFLTFENLQNAKENYPEYEQNFSHLIEFYEK